MATFNYTESRDGISATGEIDIKGSASITEARDEIRSTSTTSPVIPLHFVLREARDTASGTIHLNKVYTGTASAVTTIVGRTSPSRTIVTEGTGSSGVIVGHATSSATALPSQASPPLRVIKARK